MRRLIAIGAALALLAIVASACGGGGSSSGSTSSGSTSSGNTESSGSTNTSGSGDASSASANEACAEANKKIAALGTPNNNNAVLKYLEQTEQAVEQLQVEVAGMGGPSSMTAYSKALSDSVTVLNEMANAARSGNPDGVRELSKELEKLHVGKLAEAAGLETCAEVPGVES